jgi:hypothetical protein
MNNILNGSGEVDEDEQLHDDFDFDAENEPV